MELAMEASMPPFFALEGRNHSTNPQPMGEDWFIFKLVSMECVNERGGQSGVETKNDNFTSID